MATRYYFPFSTGAPSAPVGTIPVAAAWDLTGAGFSRGYATTSKLNTPLTAETSTGFQETSGSIGNLVHKQYVSDPLEGDQTISGTFTLVLRCGEVSAGGTNSNADMSLQCVIRVIKPDGTERGVLYNGHTTALNQTSGAVGQEMNTSTQVRLMNGVAVSTVNALSRDRIVIELGHRHHNTLTDFPYQSFLHLGDSTAVADHPVSTTSEAKPGWIELSSTLVHNLFGTGTITETGSVSSTGQKVAKGDNTISATTSASTSTGQKVAKAAVTVSATSSATSTGKKVAKVTGTLSGVSGATSTGAKKSVEGTADLPSTAGLTPAGKKVANGTVNIAGAESLSSEGGVPLPTRYYFPYGVGAPAAPRTDIAPAAGWDLVGAGFGRGLLTTRKRNTALFAETSTQFTETSTTPGNLAHEQYISEPLAYDQTVSGKFTLVLRCGEISVGGTASNADISLQCIIRVIKPDGTERGILYGGHTSGLNASAGAVGQEMSTTTAVRLMNGVNLTPVAALEDDRIVVELGHRHHNTTNVVYGSYLHLGDSTAVADHPKSTTSTAAPGWFEISHPVGHKIPGSAVMPDATASISAVGNKVAKRDITLPAASTLTSSGAKVNSTVLTIPFDGTDEATVTTTGTGLSTVTTAAGTVTFEINQPYSGASYMEVATTATASAPQVIANVSPGQATFFGRFFIKLTAFPSVDLQVFRMRGTSFAQRLTMKIMTDGKVQLHNGTAEVAISVNPIVLNKWVMVHVGYTGSTMTIKTYEGASLTTPSKTLTGAATVDTIQSIMFGFMNSISNYTLGFDDAVFDYQDYPPGVSRVGGTGDISGLAIFAKSGLKRAVSYGWAVTGILNPSTATGNKNTGEGHDGSGTITGVGTLPSARSGKKVAKGANILTATSALSAAGRKVGKSSPTLPATGNLSSTGRKIAKGTITLAGVAALIAGTGKKRSDASASVSANSTLTALGTKVAKGGPSEALAAVTTALGSAGRKKKVFVTGTVTGASTLGVVGQGKKVAKGTLNLSGTGVLSAIVKKIAIGFADITGPHTLTPDGSRNANYFQGTGTLSGNTVSATSTGKKVAKVTGTVSGLVIFAKSTKKVAKGIVTISAVSSGPTSTAGSIKVAKGNPVLGTFAGMASTGSKNAEAGESIVNAFASIIAGAGKKKTKIASGSNSGTGNVVSLGRKTAKGTGFTAGFGTISSIGAARQHSVGIGAITAAGLIVAAPGFKRILDGGDLVISHVAVFAAHGIKRARGNPAESLAGTLTQAGRKVARGATQLVTSAGASSTGKKSGKGSVTLTAAATLEAQLGDLRHIGTGAISAASLLSGEGDFRQPRTSIRVGGNYGAVLVGAGAGISRAIPIGVPLED